ncbi:sodium-independent organic anion transporter [Dictyocaulus viviparus]|uniref:Sodium-independent organic anion transporter n=1 Tax=Dictyocaulus viviparus TaxID=29172 RepID=A0A0D8XY98_DICVI|nr:sodium-independent organic anion transporter [Dictyocaulus viviparus]
MRETESNADSDSDAETRSAPGDLGAPPRSRTAKWSHSRQASQGVPYRNVEKPRRIRDIRVRQWQKQVAFQHSLLAVGRSDIYRPTWLSFLGSRKWMVILLCWYCAVQGIVVNGLVPSAISSIERRFKLSTSTMGRIVQFYDFGYVLFCIPVSYFGGRHSKPFVLGAGLALLAIGSMLFSTPHIVSGDETDPSWVGAWWIGFVLASLVAMIAVIPIICLPKILPESLKWHRNRLVETAHLGRRRTPECCGLSGTNKTAALYQDAPIPDTSSLLFTSIAVRGRGPLWYKLWLDVRHIPIAIYRILTNAPFMLITLAMAIDSLVVTGASSFMSKYLERQFNVPPSRSSLLIGSFLLMFRWKDACSDRKVVRSIMVILVLLYLLHQGCIMVPMAGVGCMISGFIVQYFRLNCVTTLKLSVGLLFFSLILTPMYLIYCPHDPLVGVETTYPDRDGQISMGNYSDVELSLQSACNSHCRCNEAEFRPVCAEFLDGRQLSYYSPCFAGCLEPYTPLQKVYSNCSCVVETARLHVRHVKKGLCESKCKGLLGFLIIFAPLSLCTFAVGVPIISVILRTVDYNERSFALGIQGILVRLIGTIPAPVLFGWMFDVSCIRHQSEPCGNFESGSCLLYSNKLLADLFLTFSIIGQALAMGVLTTVLMVYGGTLQDDPLLDVPLGNVERVENADLIHETVAPLLQ